MSDKPVRHVLGISGGKDSAALALFMRDKIPQMEYFFCDTGYELQETYEYLERLEAFLGKPVVRLNPERDFDHWLKVYGNYLPLALTAAEGLRPGYLPIGGAGGRRKSMRCSQHDHSLAHSLAEGLRQTQRYGLEPLLRFAAQ